MRQLLDYLLKFEEDESKEGKGILFGNAWKELPPNERGTTETVFFPTNVVARACTNGVALVNSVDFFHAFMRFRSKEITGETILRRITETAGLLDFSE